MQTSRVSSDLGEGPAFGSCPFDPVEQQAIQATLQTIPSSSSQSISPRNDRSIPWEEGELSKI